MLPLASLRKALWHRGSQGVEHMHSDATQIEQFSGWMCEGPFPAANPEEVAMNRRGGKQNDRQRRNMMRIQSSRSQLRVQDWEALSRATSAIKKHMPTTLPTRNPTLVHTRAHGSLTPKEMGFHATKPREHQF